MIGRCSKPHCFITYESEGLYIPSCEVMSV